MEEDELLDMLQAQSSRRTPMNEESSESESVELDEPEIDVDISPDDPEASWTVRSW
jgi:hypothetical protein